MCPRMYTVVLAKFHGARQTDDVEHFYLVKNTIYLWMSKYFHVKFM